MQSAELAYTKGDRQYLERCDLIGAPRVELLHYLGWRFIVRVTDVIIFEAHCRHARRRATSIAEQVDWRIVRHFPRLRRPHIKRHAPGPYTEATGHGFHSAVAATMIPQSTQARLSMLSVCSTDVSTFHVSNDAQISS